MPQSRARQLRCAVCDPRRREYAGGI